MRISDRILSDSRKFDKNARKLKYSLNILSYLQEKEKISRNKYRHWVDTKTNHIPLGK